MKWEECLLKIKTSQREDALGNLSGGEWKTVKKIPCRATPWTDEQIALEGREVTRNEQQFLLPITRAQIPECTHASIAGGSLQEITQVVDLSPRFAVLRVKVCKR